MDRRREVRVTSNQTVGITILGKQRQKMQGTAIDLSGCGMQVVVPESVSPGDPVKIDLVDTLLLGEICYCRPLGQEFILGIELNQALSGLADLTRLNQALLAGESKPVEALSEVRSRYPTPK